MKKLLLAGVAAAGLTIAAAGAQAATIGTTPATNNVFGVREGWFGADLFLSASGPVTATVEFLGFEAGFVNTFTITGTSGSGSVDTETHDVGANNVEVFFPDALGASGTAPFFTITLAPGLLDFVFTINSGVASVANGANTAPPVSPNFFLTFGPDGDSTVDGVTAGSGTTVIIALDDGGAGPDDNHDDLVVRITLENGFIRIPEPASLALLGMGLLGLGFATRRRRA